VAAKLRLARYIPFAAGSLIGLGAFVIWYAHKIEANRFRLERLKVKLGATNKPFTAEVNGANGTKPRLTILHLSDLHLVANDWQKSDFLREVTSAQYDLVMLTGDIFENEGGLPFAADLLVKKPRLGAFAVFGNKDYYHYGWWRKISNKLLGHYSVPKAKRDMAPWFDHLRAVGYQILQNQFVRIPEAKLSLIGVDFPGIHEESLKELAGEAEKDDLLLALFHLPKNLEAFSEAGIQFDLGGHTHGGQIRVPGMGAIITDSELPRHEASGLLKRGNTIFHISRGLGADPRTNIRLFCPPAATVIELYD